MEKISPKELPKLILCIIICADTNTNTATADGVFQISDTVTPLKPNQQYDKMSIRNVDATSQIITMDNKDNQIVLSKNKDIVLMQNIHIKTANQDTSMLTIRSDFISTS